MKRIYFVAIIALFASQEAWATSVPSAVDPGQVQKRFDQPAAAPAATVQTPAIPSPSLSTKERESLASTRFTLRNVVVKGVTAFTAESMQSSYRDQIGKNISMLDAHGIASRITQEYRDRRYVLSQARVAGVSNGTLTIQVTEGYIGNVEIVGAAKGSSVYNSIAAYGEQLKQQKPVNLNDIERSLLLISDVPGATAKGALRLTKKPGVADLVVTYSLKPYEASYTIDNRGSKYLGRIQHTGTFVANSLFGNADRSQVRVITTSPTTELRFVDLQHDEAIGSNGARLGFTTSYSKTRPGDTVKSTNIVGESIFGQVKGTYPFIRTRRENLNMRAMFDARNSDVDISGSVPFTSDKLRVLRVGAGYDFADRYRGVNLIDGQVSQGLNWLGATDTGTNRSRTDGSSDFTKFNLDLSRTQMLPDNWSFLTAASGQYSLDKLLLAEQYTLGGNSGFGQAYDPSELSGDYAAAGKAELRYSRYVSKQYLQAYQAYGFYDYGKVWLRGTTTNINDGKSLSSVGLGVRTYFTPNVWGYVEGALPLTKDVANEGGNGDSPRLFFSLTGKF